MYAEWLETMISYSQGDVTRVHIQRITYEHTHKTYEVSRWMKTNFQEEKQEKNEETEYYTRDTFA